MQRVRGNYNNLIHIGIIEDNPKKDTIIVVKNYKGEYIEIFYEELNHKTTYVMHNFKVNLDSTVWVVKPSENTMINAKGEVIQLTASKIDELHQLSLGQDNSNFTLESVWKKQ